MQTRIFSVSFHANRSMLMTAGILIALLLAIACNTALSVRAGSTVHPARVECFQSIRVEAGDSLWSISDRYYSVEYGTMKQYMYRIKTLNHMTSDNVHTGAYLVVPYYTERKNTCIFT